ncbi:hypothetical protein [Streptomyces sp. NPDC049813]|uniref:hypothetical protein n=1 Tax=Streptomyces sp. NPDC049813 TaxID=3365597 RepID=UPI00379A4533
MATQRDNENRTKTARKTATGAAGTTAAKAKSAGEKAGGAAESAGSGAARAATGAGQAAGRAAQSTGAALNSAREGVTAAAGQVASVATTAWTVLKNRKMIAAGATVGATALTAASYAAGRRAERGSQGPLTRLTGGRV